MTYTILLEPQAVDDLRTIYRFIAQNDSPQKTEKDFEKTPNHATIPVKYSVKYKGK